MPADKLELVSHKIRGRFLDLAMEEGERKGGYAYVVEIPEISAVLHCLGYRTDIHKLVFRNVARLGYTYCENAAEQVFGNPSRVRIFRVDWCVDILGIPLLDLALYCRLGRIQNCRIDRSRSGTTFYPGFSKPRTTMIYDKLKQLEAKRDPIVKRYVLKGPITRVEVQFKKNLPYQRFNQLARYARLDLLPNLSFWKAPPKRVGLRTVDSLAAEGFLRKIDEHGLQMVLKMYSPQERAYLVKKFLEPAPPSAFPDLNSLLRESALDWLKDRIRFPRYVEREQS